MSYQYILFDTENFLVSCKRAETINASFKSLETPLDIAPIRNYLLMLSHFRQKQPNGHFIHSLSNSEQSKVLGKILTTLGESVVHSESFEDLSYSILKHNIEKGEKTLVATPMISASILQNMLSDKLTHFTAKTELNPDLSIKALPIFFSFSDVKLKVGCTPDLLPDLIALSGSAEKGIKEILPRKTAQEYLSKYGGLDKVIEFKEQLIGADADMFSPQNLTEALVNIDKILPREVEVKFEPKQTVGLDKIKSLLKIDDGLLSSIQDLSSSLENELNSQLNNTVSNRPKSI